METEGKRGRLAMKKNLETFLVEWKLRPTGRPDLDNVALKPS